MQLHIWQPIQAPLSLGFFRQEHWSGLPFPSPVHESGKWKVKMKSLSCVQLFTIPWTAAYKAPPPMGFSKQEYWSGLPLPSPLICILNLKLWILYQRFSFNSSPESQLHRRPSPALQRTHPSSRTRTSVGEQRCKTKLNQFEGQIGEYLH